MIVSVFIINLYFNAPGRWLRTPVSQGFFFFLGNVFFGNGQVQQILIITQGKQVNICIFEVFLGNVKTISKYGSHSFYIGTSGAQSFHGKQTTVSRAD